MSKKMFVRLLVGLAFLAAAVLFLLSELMPDTFGGFNLAWAGLIFSGVSGLAFLFSALGTKKFGHAQKAESAVERGAAGRCGALPRFCARPAR